MTLSNHPRLLFGLNLRIARTALGLTQKDVAEKVGIHHSYVGAVERGERNVSVNNMHRLAEAVDREVFDLLRPIAQDQTD